MHNAIYVGVAVVVVFLLAGAAYYFLNKKDGAQHYDDIVDGVTKGMLFNQGFRIEGDEVIGEDDKEILGFHGNFSIKDFGKKLLYQVLPKVTLSSTSPPVPNAGKSFEEFIPPHQPAATSASTQPQPAEIDPDNAPLPFEPIVPSKKRS